MSRDNALPEDAGFSALENALTRAGGQFRQRAGGRPLPAFDFARLDAAPAMEAPSAETELPFNEPALRGVEKLFARAGQEIREAAALRPLPILDLSRLDAAPMAESAFAEMELPLGKTATQGVEKLLLRAGQELRDAAQDRPLPALEWERLDAAPVSLASAPESRATRWREFAQKLFALPQGFKGWALAGGVVAGLTLLAVALGPTWGSRQAGWLTLVSPNGAQQRLGLMIGDKAIVAPDFQAMAELGETRVSLAEKTEIEINDARRVILREGSAWFHVPAGSEPLVVAAAGGEIVAAGGAVFGASFDGDRLTLDMASGGAEFIGPRLARSIRAGERIHHQPETNELLFDSNGVSMPRWARPLL